MSRPNADVVFIADEHYGVYQRFCDEKAYTNIGPDGDRLNSEDAKSIKGFDYHLVTEKGAGLDKDGALMLETADYLRTYRESFEIEAAEAGTILNSYDPQTRQEAMDAGLRQFADTVFNGLRDMHMIKKFRDRNHQPQMESDN